MLCTARRASWLCAAPLHPSPSTVPHLQPLLRLLYGRQRARLILGSRLLPHLQRCHLGLQEPHPSSSY